MKFTKICALLIVVGMFSCSGPEPYVSYDEEAINNSNDEMMLYFEEADASGLAEALDLEESSSAAPLIAEEDVVADVEGETNLVENESLDALESEFGNAEEAPEVYADYEEELPKAQNRIYATEEVWNTYKIEKNDTWMLLAFKLYGDYTKWRELYSWNKNEFSQDNLHVGNKIRYKVSGKAFVWAPKGLPHLISKGETLGTISKVHYDTPKRWREIWDNNREMIKNPDLIFTGFTLYYIPEKTISFVF